MYCDFPEFGRCCLCLPLRRGVLLFGYLNLILATVQLGLYSYSLNNDLNVDTTPLVYHGAVAPNLEGLNIFMFVMEIIAYCVLIYGAHLKLITPLMIFYYYAISATVASVLLAFISAIMMTLYIELEVILLLFAGLCVQIYLIALVKSLIRQLHISGNGTNAYENRLQQVVAGEIYEPTVVSNVAA